MKHIQEIYHNKHNLDFTEHFEELGNKGTVNRKWFFCHFDFNIEYLNKTKWNKLDPFKNTWFEITEKSRLARNIGVSKSRKGYTFTDVKKNGQSQMLLPTFSDRWFGLLEFWLYSKWSKLDG